MKRPVLTIVVNAVVCLLLGGLLVSAVVLDQNGWLDGLLGNLFTNGIYAEDDSYSVGNTTLSADGITNIDLGWGAGSVTVKVGKGSSIELTETADGTVEEKDRVCWKVENGTLMIRCGKREGLLLSVFGLDYPQKSLTLTIPASLVEQLGTVRIRVASANVTAGDLHARLLEVDTASGTVKLNNVAANTIELNTASGDLYGTSLTADRMEISGASAKQSFTDCTVSGTVECDTASGSFFYSGSLGSLDADTASGNIELHLTAPARSIEMDSASGDLTVILPSDFPGLTAEMDSASGDLIFDFAVRYQGDYAIYGDGSMKVEIDTASGNAKFRMD
ncbi:MAG: DUF4097 family beta strand repeat protein [Clostridia bacterium]|nr:DUF4097 family beta strand repeat protein [Clostridia bacterium]